MYEKRYSVDEEDSDYYYTSSARSSIHSETHILPTNAQYESHRPILSQPSHPRYSNNRSFLRSYLWNCFCACTPRKCFRWFNFIIIGSIVLFIGTLIRLHWSSNQIVESGLKKQPAPPPVWEQFPVLNRYYGGLKNIVSTQENHPEVSPSDYDYTSSLHSQPVDGLYDYGLDSNIMKCFLDAAGKIEVPELRSYQGVPNGMPDHSIGSYDVLGLDSNVCFDRFGRLGPYGYGYDKTQGGSGAGLNGDREGIDEAWSQSQVDYRTVRWHKAQQRCLKLNEARYQKVIEPTPMNHFGDQSESLILDSTPQSTSNLTKREDSTRKLSRKAIIIRTWSDYNYDDEDMFYLRSIIAELALKTGGEYTVHFLVHVRDNNVPIWADEGIYNEVLRNSLPLEFLGMGTLWSERQMATVYSNLPDNRFRDFPLHGVFRGHPMALTWFAYQHPEYERFWQFEMDLRYTGHFYELLTKSSEWATAQPRKYLWERNARFYIPAEHGSWEDFSHMVRVQTEHGTASKSNMYAGMASDPEVPDSVKSQYAQRAENPVWGPLVPLHDVLDNTSSVIPPWEFAQDKNEWGVGEDADLIVFNPLFDPEGTDWLLANDMTGYNTSSYIPRRAAVTTFGAYSRRLLVQMHREMAVAGKHMFTEMMPATVALHHGFKAVSVPHPMIMERQWPTPYLAKTFNGGRNGQSGGSRYSVFSHERENNFRTASWYYNSDFAQKLWKKWIGAEIHGGSEEEPEGRMCLRSLLIHPVKQVDLVYGIEEQ
jgi:hypothetical protein